MGHVDVQARPRSMTLHQPPASAGPASASHRWGARLLPPLAALIMLGLTYLYWQSEEDNIRAQRSQNFHAAADQIAYNLKDRMATYEVVLRGVKGYFEGSEHIDREEFRTYVDALQLIETRPGLRSISLILHVRADELQSHTDQVRTHGVADYSVRPPGARDTYAPITHIEPMDADNQKAFGFDALTVVGAREALERAVDTGEVALTGRILRVQDNQPGLAMYLPVYAARADLQTIAGRRAAQIGWVSATFRMADVIAGLAKEFDTDIELQIMDTTAGVSAVNAALFGAAGFGAAGPALRTSRTLEVGGRRWTLQMAPMPAFDQRHRDRNHLPVAVLGAVLSVLLGWFIWLLATGRDRAVTLARKMTAELRATRDDLESTLNAIPDLLFELDKDGCIHHYRSARSDLLALPPEMFLGRCIADVVPAEAAEGCFAALDAAHRTGYSAGHQYRLDINGTSHWFELSIARKEGGAPGAVNDGPRFIALSRDVTERKQAEARTHQLAYFDTLTGLPNRRMLTDRLEHALHSARQTSQIGALIYIDLDNFKQINDARGHKLGDTLLVQVAQRLSQQLQPGDTVAHLGGDEFVVLVNDVAADLESAGRAAMLVAEGLRSALEAPYAIDSHLYSSTGSLGITLFPKRDEGVEDLLREADTAMYRAKDLGRNRIRFYEAAMQADVQERMALEQDLKKAHAEGQLAAFVQSQVDATGRVVGGELLMRWEHPVRGNVPPARFIPIAESSGLILRMGDWMIRQACETLARLQAVGLDMSLSVNVSERQFRQEDFVECVRHLLAHTGAKPENLVLEVTESLLIENLSDTIARMTEIVQLGVRFSIDDFGTGYSSLAYLKRLPLYELKIDKSFVQDTPDDPNDTAIVQSIISVARHLNLRVVAEGVETTAQADFLTRSQCDCLQGYLFGRPEPLDTWVARLAPRG